MISLLDILKDIPLISFDISNTRCGVSTASKLAELLSGETKFKAAIKSLTMDSTGVMEDEYGRTGHGTQKAYTLTTGEQTIDLGQKNLGSVDVALLTAWLQRPKVSAASLKISGALTPFTS
jgi:hypothetical protein